MTEKELLIKIRKLRSIQPRKDWVILTKSQILGMTEVRPQSFLSLFFKPAYAGLIVVFVFFGLFGVFGVAQNSLPGDILYSFKRVIEKGQAVFVSEDEKPEYGLEMANKRLEELNKIAENNQVKNLVPALDEFKRIKKAAKKSVSNSIKGKSKSEAIKLAKKVAPGLNEINKKEEAVFGSLGIDSEEKENGSTDKIIIELLIGDAASSTLTEEQAGDLVKVKGYYENGEYAKALEFYFTSFLNKND